MNSLLIIFFSLSLSFQNKIEERDMYENAVTLIKKYETWHGEKNPNEMGYGHTILSKQEKMLKSTFTREQGDSLLRKDLNDKMKCFKHLSFKYRLLAGMLAYNIGENKVKKSTFLKELNKKNPNMKIVFIQYKAWNKYNGRFHKGLFKRRVEELKIIFK